EGDLDDVVALLGGGARLVTLTGPGGVGKTSLALEAARRVADRFADGAWLVELAGLERGAGGGSPAVVAEVVLAALAIRQAAEDRPGVTPVARLAEALAGRRTLLVLDNCEHVVDAVARLVDELLRAAPDAVVLATSRERLAVEGEVVRTVRPLNAPGPDQQRDVEAVRRASAVRLLVERARAAGAEVDVDEASAPLLATPGPQARRPAAGARARRHGGAGPRARRGREPPRRPVLAARRAARRPGPAPDPRGRHRLELGPVGRGRAVPAAAAGGARRRLDAGGRGGGGRGPRPAGRGGARRARPAGRPLARRGRPRTGGDPVPPAGVGGRLRRRATGRGRRGRRDPRPPPGLPPGAGRAGGGGAARRRPGAVARPARRRGRQPARRPGHRGRRRPDRRRPAAGRRPRLVLDAAGPARGGRPRPRPVPGTGRRGRSGDAGGGVVARVAGGRRRPARRSGGGDAPGRGAGGGPRPRRCRRRPGPRRARLHRSPRRRGRGRRLAAGRRPGAVRGGEGRLGRGGGP